MDCMFLFSKWCFSQRWCKYWICLSRLFSCSLKTLPGCRGDPTNWNRYWINLKSSKKKDPNPIKPVLEVASRPKKQMYAYMSRGYYWSQEKSQINLGKEQFLVQYLSNERFRCYHNTVNEEYRVCWELQYNLFILCFLFLKVLVQRAQSTSSWTVHTRPPQEVSALPHIPVRPCGSFFLSGFLAARSLISCLYCKQALQQPPQIKHVYTFCHCVSKCDSIFGKNQSRLYLFRIFRWLLM